MYSFNDKHIRLQTNTHCQKEVIKHCFEVRQRISEICESDMEKNIQDPKPKISPALLERNIHTVQKMVRNLYLV